MPQLRFLPSHEHSDRKLALLGIPDQFPYVGLGDGGLVFVVDDHAGFERIPGGIAERHEIIAVAGQLLSQPEARP